MKRFRKSQGVGVALAALALAGLSPHAKAIPLTGNYQGAITIKIDSLDSGNIYVPAAPNTTTYTTGVSNLNAPAGIFSTAPNAQASTVPGAGNEDTWGIFTVTSIQGSASQALFNAGSSGYELVGIIYNGVDNSLTNTTGVTGLINTQTITSQGTIIDIYEIPTNTNIDLATLNPSARGPGGTFAGLTNLPGATLALELNGVSGSVLDGEGVVDPGADIVTSTNVSTTTGAVTTGSGVGYFNVNNALGNSASQFDTGVLGTQVAGVNANVSIAFTTSTSTSTDSWYHTPWTVADSDPVQADVVPEPTSMLAGLACLVPILGMVTSRRRKALAPTETCATA